MLGLLSFTPHIIDTVRPASGRPLYIPTVFGAHPLSRLPFVDRLCLLWGPALTAIFALNDLAKITKHLAQLHVDMYSA